MYLYLKAAHIVATTAWLSTLLLLPLVALSQLRAGSRDALHATRALYSKVGTPAMVLSLALGLFLAQSSGAMSAGWLQLKLLLVLGLCVAHGVIAGSMGRLLREPHRDAPAWFQLASLLVLLCFAAIAFIVVIKP